MHRGVAMEVVAFADHLKFDNLVFIYDYSARVSLGMTTLY
jgi:transketolase